MAVSMGRAKVYNVVWFGRDVVIGALVVVLIVPSDMVLNLLVVRGDRFPRMPNVVVFRVLMGVFVGLLWMVAFSCLCS